MTRSDFVDRLRQLRRATSKGHARMLVGELRPGVSRMDAVLRREFLAAVAQHGLAAHPIEPISLTAGETWLLLFEAPQTGHAVRIRADLGAMCGGAILPEARRAYRGLVTTVARACKRLGHWDVPMIDVDVPYAKFEVEGGSLGLSVAIAALSAELGRPPGVETAGSAQVLDDGRLRPVAHLAAKLEALQRSWPEVRRVVVARGQSLPEGFRSPVPLVEAAHLTDAIPLFALDLDALPHARLTAFRDRVQSFHSDNEVARDATEWARLSLEARAAAEALAKDEPAASAEATLWAALFAVHAGDPETADTLLERLPEQVKSAFPELQARELITSASSRIDTDVARAIELAERAVVACESLAARDKRALLGQALGTQGRARMHAGDLGAAEPLLRNALKHHQVHDPTATEALRSAVYLATCLRLSGRLQEALQIVNDALAEADALAVKWDLAATTRLFLRLERGRIYLSLERCADAISDFAFVRDGQQGDSSYPRLGAVRGLARALRLVGRTEEADRALSTCLSVARSISEPTLCRVGAIAAGEALLDPRVSQIPRSEIEHAWTLAFGTDTTPGHLAAVIRGWVY